MNALLGALLATVAFCGLLLVVLGAVGTRVSIDRVAAQLHEPRTTNRRPVKPGLGRLLGFDRPGRSAVEADLAICGKDGAALFRQRLAWACLLCVFAVAATVAVPLAGASSPDLRLSSAVGIVSAVGGWFYGVVDLHADAEKARRELRHAVATYVQLVTILMAGGAGVESAMFVAAETGASRSFRHLHSALAAAQVRNRPPWTQLGPLGERLAIRELRELGSALSLAGGGAQVKETLATRASTIRTTDISRVERDANARSETMALPVVLMFAGFLLLVGYPALAGLTAP